MFLWRYNPGMPGFSICAALATGLLLSGCNIPTASQVMPVYTWDFYKIRPDATAKEQALKACESEARRRNRFVGNGYMQGYNVAGDVLTCMKWEGWGQSTDPVSFRPIQRVE